MSREVDLAVAQWAARYGGDRVSVAELLCDRHVGSDAVALLYKGARTELLSFAELQLRSSRLAGALRAAGVSRDDRVAVMLPKCPELLVALLAIWRLGAVHVPLFTAFGPDAVDYRRRHSGARLIITDSVNRPKVADDQSTTVVCVAGDGGPAHATDVDFAQAQASGSPIQAVARRGDDLMVVLYTSGTTGHPKGVEVPVRALASIHSYMHFSLDVRPEDVYWNIADPGWAYGLWFGVIGPLLLGRTTLMRGGPFDAQDGFRAIVDHRVTNLAGAPTVYRALRAAGVPEGFRQHSRLRIASSAGEPLNAEVLQWSARELGVAIHDHYGQSELGMAVGFAHHPALRRDVVPSSMGFPAPGFRPVVVGEGGQELQPGTQGELAIDVSASPLYWFRGYLNDAGRTAERFRHGARYYLTGDNAQFDEAGLLHFASRADDIISSSGYRVGPFEVESALMAHPAVAEVAVIGTPDELRGEAITAFVVPTLEVVDRTALVAGLQQFVKSRLAKHLYPRHVVFVEDLPRTASGKIRRAELRAQWRRRATPSAGAPAGTQTASDAPRAQRLSP